MTRALSMLLVVLLSGCATIRPVPLTVPEAKWVETQPLPTDPATEKIAAKDGEWVVPMDEEQCIQKDGKIASDAGKPCPGRGGLLVSEEKITRLKLYEIGYKQLRANYAVDRVVWSAQRDLYEARLKDAGEALQRSHPDWFQLHAGELGTLLGLVVGVAATVGVVYGVAPAFNKP